MDMLQKRVQRRAYQAEYEEYLSTLGGEVVPTPYRLYSHMLSQRKSYKKTIAKIEQENFDLANKGLQEEIELLEKDIVDTRDKIRQRDNLMMIHVVAMAVFIILFFIYIK